MKKCIINGKIILHDEIVNKNVFIEDDKITEISNRQPEDEDIIDAKYLSLDCNYALHLHHHNLLVKQPYHSQ